MPRKCSQNFATDSESALVTKDLQGVKISVFPLTLLVIVTTVLPLPRSLW